MAYCVNCGVELDPALDKCPLCSTPVYRPHKLSQEDKQPFPDRKGEVEKVSKKDAVIFISVLFLTISITCGLLNALVYNSFWWAVPVDGLCITLWVFCMTGIFVHRITGYGMLLFDAAAIANYMFMITLITSNDEWFYYVGLPILGVIFVLMELFLLFSRILPFSILVGTLYFFIGVAGICTTIETVLDLFIHQTVSLSWSAIVLTVCVIISVFLIMVLMMGRLRNTVRKRLHF